MSISHNLVIEGFYKIVLNRYEISKKAFNYAFKLYYLDIIT